MNLLIKRILAFLVDYLVILSYAAILYVFSVLFFPLSEFNEGFTYNPFQGQLIGFLSLTLPVFLYSLVTENSRWHATLGKKVLKLIVETAIQNRFAVILKRNVLKYLPWEIAHTGIHWLFYYNSLGLEIPIWVWILLILPQIMVMAYFISILVKQGKQSLYDMISKTKISYMIN